MKIIESGWYAVQIGPEEDLDRGSENFNDALNIALQYAINDDYNGQQIRIITCDIYEDGSLSLCTNEKIIREGSYKIKKDLQAIKEEMLVFTIETILGFTDSAREAAEKYISSYASDFTIQHNEARGWKLTKNEINEVVNFVVDNYF